jgi:alpha-L-fucosidase
MTAYEPTWESVRSHEVPAWYDEAKLGVFLHWGLYSVPGWAPRVPDIQTILRQHPPSWFFRNNPYAEWYANTLSLEGSPTQRHHAETYGREFPYDGFAPLFDQASAKADLDELASVCQRAGARYVVLTTKHHDGYCLWPASRPHPVKGAYHARRDLVADLDAAVRASGMRMGLYYSGGYDWPLNGAVLDGPADALLAAPPGKDYAQYADCHVRELVDRYRPSVLWNDISWPPGSDLSALFAHYYNAVDDGVVNDRWVQVRLSRRRTTDAIVAVAGDLLDRLWRFVPDSRKEMAFPRPPHCDFSTHEYVHHRDIVAKKWEATRGVGHSFGANRNEAPEEVLTTTELVRTFVDIVSKNGNLLIGVGPEPDGRIPCWQQQPLLGLGQWLQTHGEAVYASRPWDQASATTSQGTDVRFTWREETLYAMLLETPGTARFDLPGIASSSVTRVDMLGLDAELDWRVAGDTLSVTLPERLPVSPVHTLRLWPVPRSSD